MPKIVTSLITAAMLSLALAPAPASAQLMPFDDVAPSDYFYEPVLWMAQNSITTGVSNNEFAPYGIVDRGQAATFIWRFMGEPSPTSSSGFVDVDNDDYFHDAVDWMAATGITTGTSADTYSPDGSLTRGQIATLLWRLAGEPAAASGTTFSDVFDGQYFSDAVGWMVEHGITTGTTSTTFSPSDAVTRAQLATFLWRLAGTPDAFDESADVSPFMRSDSPDDPFPGFISANGTAVPSEDDTFLFVGGGWGHGVGMSQYGALGRATAGQSAEQILEYYYDGSSVQTRASELNAEVGDGIRVRLSPAYGGDRPDWVDIEIVGSTDRSDPDYQFGSGLTATIGNQVIEVGNKLTLRQGGPVSGSTNTWRWYLYDDLNATGTDICSGCVDSQPVINWPEGAVVRISDEFNPNLGTHDVGELHFASQSSGQGFVVLHMPMDEYLSALAEMPSSWHSEALQAQAIAGRSYAYHQATVRSGFSYDVFDSVSDQVYGGHTAKSTGRINAAYATTNQVVTYNGNIVQTFYSSSNGGYSESTVNSSSFSAPQAWHISKPDPYDSAVGSVSPNPNRYRLFEFTVDEVSQWLAEYTLADIDVGTVERITVSGLPPSGRITNALVTVEGSDRTIAIRRFINGSYEDYGLRFQTAIQRGCESDYGTSRDPQTGLFPCPRSSNFTLVGD